MTKRVAIPVEGDVISSHFGHSKLFNIYTVDNSLITKTEVLTPPPHEPGSVPRWLKSLNVDIVVAKGIGQKAVEILNSQGIEVNIGVNSCTPENAIDEWIHGALKTGENLCDH
jgi:predicted Fe-Mo cluster-binding NifX family protein